MKIAILGTRGIPCRYGGFETLAEQLSKRLVARGHEVSVYCRRPFTPEDDGLDPRIQRIILPTIKTKHFDTAFHTLLSVIHVLFTKVDVILLCNVANSALAWIPRLFGIPTVLNVDGLDRKRKKWNIFARSYLFLCELLALFTPTRTVTDAREIQRYFWQRYRKRTIMIGYGAEPPPNDGVLEGFGLIRQKYILYVSRLEPENNPELVLRAYRKVETDWPLVMVGGNCYDQPFVEHLKALASDRVIFPGPVYGREYWQLLQNAGMYVSACEVGGLHPALIEAMAARNTVLYLDTPVNREAAGDCGLPFPKGSSGLSEQMARALRDAALRQRLEHRAKARAQSLFTWDAVVARYEALFAEVLNLRTSGAPIRIPLRTEGQPIPPPAMRSASSVAPSKTP
jgi:glycosyltransferase involved in cell wall biosynthesis